MGKQKKPLAFIKKTIHYLNKKLTTKQNYARKCFQQALSLLCTSAQFTINRGNKNNNALARLKRWNSQLLSK